ncbi:beta-1,3-galactosyltransferase 5 isoform X1 [Daphnia magna]|uniref:beta-1,3-galactosyltransferase 5 isoform X1 n=1 Tax=Daphnia magna TaxID=35525 RepID=UPI001E1BA616|nr:beta-1,3-galactosyltransferase 5 isoform X1 [Daphnia magna]XP_032784356.2 beta-1,3-galactosyltransferase 5 isoform X1 [Daphnia magna]XP_032784372.2 beta-1,3-galactosyltransferase 5 isoform X1 [Daphnia magna]XP_032784382.2 beta-1,3-galactosyltransferase 5 isoform X1 [Daphnia magna]XP_045030789.1 beta-1,3-galactosyltransferase 5 isoform X1 [Daphnia magna]XP_045030792.1 beta-1,3-galactosyltransferase 5 isoform X1 [Daphnia magna]XP_045030795.1 beta-1,3-galactosyltransferase 5 isoform X1 [Daphn
MMRNVQVMLGILLTLWITADSQLKNHTNDIIHVLNEERKVLYSYAAPYLLDNPYPGVEKYTHYEMARLGMLPLVNVKPLIPKLGPVINDVTSFKYPITVSSCRRSPTSRSVFIAVISATENVLNREKIRKTWKNHVTIVVGKGLLSMARFVFVLGMTNDSLLQSKIRGESMLHGDILQVDILDFYRNLPSKMAGLLNWVNANCPGVGFLLKADDDICVNVYNLANIVQSYHLSGNLTIFGCSHHVGILAFNNWGPMREGQHKITLDAWPWSSYPNYINGPVYLLHGSTVLPLLAAIQTTPMIPFEDVYLTGICPEKVGIKTLFSSGPTSMLALGSLYSEYEARNYLAWNDWMSSLPYKKVDDLYRGTSDNVTASVKFHFRSNYSTFP